MNYLVLLVMATGTFIGGMGALLIKIGLNYHNSLRSIFKNYRLAGGFLLFGLAFLPYLWALKQEELSIVFPLASLSYLWITLFSVLFLKEKMTKWKWLSLMGIILGIVFIGQGS